MPNTVLGIPCCRVRSSLKEKSSEPVLMFSHLPMALVSGPFLTMHALCSHARRHPEQCAHWMQFSLTVRECMSSETTDYV